jgi:hypothetical protein
MYELDKADDILGEVEQFDREVQLQVILQVLDFRVQNGGCSMRMACDELGVPYQRFTRWIKQGVLTDYLQDQHDPEMEILRLRAMQAMPGVLENMIALANGKKSMKGVNPVAAAQFVKEMVGPAREEHEEPATFIQNNYFQPQQYRVPYKDAAPVIEVIDAEVKE